MRKSNVKIKGKLRTYLYLPLLLTMLLIIINVFVYMEDTSSGVLFSGFVLLYFVIMLIAYLRNKPLLIDELINFATQYGLVQKQLLNEFEIPYALVDYNAKFLWVNEQFTEVTGKDKKYHKSVMTVFPTAGIFVIVKRADRHAVSADRDAVQLRCLSGGYILFDRFKYIQNCTS